MSQDASTSRSAGKSKAKAAASKSSHPPYATMIKQSLAAIQVTHLAFIIKLLKPTLQ